MDWGRCTTKEGVATIDCVNVVFVNIVNGLLMFAGVATLAIFMVAGFRYMNSSGDPKKLESARGALTYGLIGLAVILFSFLIISVISIVTGIEFSYDKILPPPK